MYKSPINIYETLDDIVSGIQEKEDKYIMECVSNVGVDVDKDELIKALEYDRDQYRKGYEDGLKQISDDFKKAIDIVFSNDYPEDKEGDLIELLQPYRNKESD